MKWAKKGPVKTVVFTGPETDSEISKCTIGT
jgi:hypothetical protein